MAELDKNLNKRERELLAEAKATVTSKNDNDRGAIIQTIRKLKNDRLRVYYSYVGEEVNVTPTQQFGKLCVTFYGMDHLYFHHNLQNKYVQLLYKCHEDNSVRMMGANNSVFDEEKDLRILLRNHSFLFKIR
jgi:hypothetical protein